MSEPNYTPEDFKLLQKKLPWVINKSTWADLLYKVPYDCLPLLINTFSKTSISEIIVKWRLEIGK